MDISEMQTTSNRWNNVWTFVTVPYAQLMDEDEDVSEEFLEFEISGSEKWTLNKAS